MARELTRVELRGGRLSSSVNIRWSGATSASAWRLCACRLLLVARFAGRNPCRRFSPWRCSRGGWHIRSALRWLHLLLLSCTTLNISNEDMFPSARQRKVVRILTPGAALGAAARAGLRAGRDDLRCVPGGCHGVIFDDHHWLARRDLGSLRHPLRQSFLSVEASRRATSENTEAKFYKN